MTYGVWTPDFKAYSLSGVTLETARRYCTKDMGVCSERDKLYGYAFRVIFRGGIEFGYRWGTLYIGPISFSIDRLTHKAPETIIQEGQNA